MCRSQKRGSVKVSYDMETAEKGQHSAEKTVEEIFADIDHELSAQDEIRDKIRSVRDEADAHVRFAQRSLASIHTILGDLSVAAQHLCSLLPPIGQAITAVERSCPDQPGSYYKYHDLWRNVLQQAVYISVFLEFIHKNELARPDRIQELLDAKVQLPLEDYLWGVCHAIAELPRLAMNRVTVGDYLTPKKCAVFGANIFEAFKQINFRNDFLRKKYDGMKYDVKRIEEIIYDLSIRGLLRDGTSAPAASTEAVVESTH